MGWGPGGKILFPLVFLVAPFYLISEPVDQHVDQDFEWGPLSIASLRVLQFVKRSATSAGRLCVDFDCR